MSMKYSYSIYCYRFICFYSLASRTPGCDVPCRVSYVPVCTPILAATVTLDADKDECLWSAAMTSSAKSTTVLASCWGPRPRFSERQHTPVDTSRQERRHTLKGWPRNVVNVVLCSISPTSCTVIHVYHMLVTSSRVGVRNESNNFLTCLITYTRGVWWGV